jgi:hypothetical protein
MEEFQFTWWQMALALCAKADSTEHLFDGIEQIVLLDFIPRSVSQKLRN